MTGTEVMFIVRKRINDSGGLDPTDADAIPFINKYTRYIWNHRPDSLMDSNGNQRDLTEIAAIGDMLDLSDTFTLNLSDGLTGEILAWRGRNKEDMERAEYYTKLFKAAIG